MTTSKNDQQHRAVPMTPERRAEAIRLFLPILEIEEAHDPVLGQIIRRRVIEEQSIEEIADARLQHWARALATMLRQEDRPRT
jgi:hypothetical protein